MASDVQLQTALVNADKAGDVEGARTLAAEITRRRSTPELTPPTPTGPNWENYYAGTDGLNNRVKPAQAAAFDALQKTSKNPEEAVMGAINQTYWQNHLKDLPPGSITSNWPTVRNTIGKEMFGRTGETSEANLYSMTGARLKDTAFLRKLEFQNAGPLDRMVMTMQAFPKQFGISTGELAQENMAPSVEVGAIKDAPNVPALGIANPALAAGVWNSFFKPTVEAASSPLSLGTIGVGGLLGEAKAVGIPLAKESIGLIQGLFAAAMAHDVVKQAPQTVKTMNDPTKSFQDKVEAVGNVVTPLVFGVTAAFESATNFMPIKEKAALIKKVETAKNPAEAAQILREEAIRVAREEIDKTYKEEADLIRKEKAAVSPLPSEAKGLNEVAAKVEELATKEQKAAVAEAVSEVAKTETSEGGPASAIKEEKPVERPETTKETPATIPPQKGEPIGIRNEVIESELAKMGEEAPTKAESMTFKKVVEETADTVKKDPNAGKRMVEELSQNPRVLTPHEEVLLGFEANRLRVERDAAEVGLIEAQKSGKPTEDAMKRVEQAREDFKKLSEVADKTGTKGGQSLAFRKVMLKEDYSLAAMEQRRSAANEGKPLTTEQLAEVKDLHERLKTAQAKIDQLQVERKAPSPRPSAKVTEFITKQASEARARIKARMAEGRVQAGLDPADLADHAIIGAEYIAKGVTKFAEWSEAMVKDLGERIRPFLKEIYDHSLDAKDQATRLEAFKIRKAKGTEALKEKIAKGDFEPKAKKPPVELDEEGRRAQAEYDMIKLEYQHLLEKDRYERSSTLSKASQQLLGGYDAARLLMTTGEFSFILRQGKVGALSHPILTAKALPDTFRALMEDPVGAHALNLKVLNHPDAVAAKAAKLHLVDEGASLHKTEEILVGKMLGEKLPLVGKFAQKFNQAALVFLNRLRFDIWQDMRKVGLTPIEEKQLAMFVNESTGRGGLGALEPAAVPLARVMFSPRYFASRIQLATGHALWGGTWETRRIIAKEYAKTLVGLGLYYSTLKLYFDSIGDKDAEIGTDPRSSDFGKIRMGKTRLDPLAGVAQVAVFAARTATGEKTTTTGKTNPLRGENVPYGGEKWSDVAATFARSKLHPVPGAIVNLFDGTDMGGNKVTVGNQVANMVAPVTYMDVYQALEEQDLPEGVSLGLLAMLGEGLQTYGNKKPAQPINK